MLRSNLHPTARSLSCVVATFALLAGAACGAEKKPVRAPSSEALDNNARSETTITSGEVQHVSPNISVSADIALACKLQLNDISTTPKFDFDRSDLLPADFVALQSIGDCLTYGPLKGRSVKLIGRADPRGATEYNMALGAKRADSVGVYLARLGVDTVRMNVTSRGELDAVGIDEMGWKIDRRVDIVLLTE